MLGGAAVARAGEGDEARIEFFEAKIRPLLVERCYDCHEGGKREPKAGLYLDSREGLRRGGASGAVIVPGDPESSLLIHAIRYGDEELAMPPDEKLSDAEIAAFEEWIRMGAPDPRGSEAEEEEKTPVAERVAIDLAKAREHWAFNEMARVGPPTVEDEGWAAGAVDRFVYERLAEEGMRPAPEADRRTLIRRASFDLIGLPPTEEEIREFLEDESPGAFEKVVERLLASEHYGERWARYWLDIARYADSNGLDENLALGNAWRYRDYVVRSFNGDKPYDQFVREQLAGDLLLEPESEEQLFDQWIATGFLMLGPKMLAEQDKEKLVSDIVDEQIDVTSRALLGLTVSCARCHDHKYDPVPTQDYYALAGIFQSTGTMAHLDHVSRWNERNLATREEEAVYATYKKAVSGAEQGIGEVKTGAERGMQPVWRRNLSAYLLAGTAESRRALFVEAEDFSRGNLSVDDSVWGSRDVKIVHTGSNGDQFAEYDLTFERAGRYQVEVRYTALESRPVKVLLNGEVALEKALGTVTGSWFPDTQEWFRIGVFDFKPGRNVLRIERKEAVPHLDKLVFVRVPGGADEVAWPGPEHAERGLIPAVVRNWADYLTQTAREDDALFGVWNAYTQLAPERFAQDALSLTLELRVERDEGRFEVSPVVAGLLDGTPPTSLSELAGRYQAAFSVVDNTWRAQLAEHAKKTAQKEKAEEGEKKDEYKKPAKLQDAGQELARKVLYGANGPFGLPRRTLESFYPIDVRADLKQRRLALEQINEDKPEPFKRALCVKDGKPKNVPVHIRGSHLMLAKDEVQRGFLQVTDHCVDPPAVDPEASGRLELAEWLTSPEHPLTARVMVNRIWKGHFGEGLVRTPSNFGLRGEGPSHPELLDWLARKFVANGWSVKAMHREIMLSRAYRMSSRYHSYYAKIDPANRLLWRMNRRRLDAELVRDSLLAVGGSLDRELGGSQMMTPNAQYVTNDQSNNKARYASPRRSIYLPVIRNAMYDFFTAFDYNDPSVPVAQRPASTVPQQALTFMNSPLVLEQAGKFADRLLGDEELSDESRVNRAYVIAYGREATVKERMRALDYLGVARGLNQEIQREGGGDKKKNDEKKSMEQESSEHAEGQEGNEDSEEERQPPHPDRPLWQGLCQVLMEANEFIYVD